MEGTNKIPDTIEKGIAYGITIALAVSPVIGVLVFIISESNVMISLNYTLWSFIGVTLFSAWFFTIEYLMNAIEEKYSDDRY